MYNFFTSLLIFLVFIFFTGCAGQLVQTPHNKQVFISYKIGDLKEVSIGDPIIEVERADIQDAYEVLFDYQPPPIGILNIQQPFLIKGSRYTAVARNAQNQNIVYIREEGPEKKYEDILYLQLISINSDGKINQGWVLSNGTIPVQGTWTKESLFTKSTIPSRVGNSFKAQIVYSGLFGNTVKAIYREFSNDYARPAFSQELQYNIEENNIIAYRSVKIKILKATNTLIQFVVSDDGGLPWFSN